MTSRLVLIALRQVLRLLLLSSRFLRQELTVLRRQVPHPKTKVYRIVSFIADSMAAAAGYTCHPCATGASPCKRHSMVRTGAQG